MSTEALQPTKPLPRALHITLWVVQALLGVMFLFAGFTKLTQPMEALATQMPWTTVVGTGVTRFIGASELFGGLGLILPSATRIKPGLTSLAALGLLTVMLLAAAFHLSRGEYSVMPINFMLAALNAFVAWGRFKKAPIAPR